jgi:uncharacterized membrane protein
MATLVVLSYADEHRAAEVHAALRRLRETGAFAHVGDAVYLVRRTDWTVVLSREVDLSATDDCCVRYWRGLVSSLILAPGAASLRGRPGEYGIDSDFERRVTASLPPGSSAVLLLAPPHAQTRLTRALHSFGGTMSATRIKRVCAHERGEDQGRRSMNTLMAAVRNKGSVTSR